MTDGRVPRSQSQWATGGADPGITTIGDDLLRNIATPVPRPSLETEHLVTALTSTIRRLGGAGIAAPQIGVPQSVAVVEVRRTDMFPDRPESPLLALVNPRVTAWTEEELEDWEGCFSIPNLVGRVRRPAAVTVEHVGSDGAPISSTFEGYLARVVQHEIDHLNGVLYVDKLTSTRTLTTLEHYRRRIASGS